MMVTMSTPAVPLPARHLLVCVLADERAPAVIEQGRQLHAVQGGGWSVVAIETPAAARRGARVAVHTALEQAEHAGADILRLGTAGDGRHDIVAAIVQRARREHATMLLVGLPQIDVAIWRGEGERLARLVEDLAEALPDIWLQVVTPPRDGERPPAPPALAAAGARPRSWRRGWPDTIAVLLVSTLVGLLIEPWFEPVNLIMLYLAGIVWVALRHGGPAALLATVGSIAMYDFVLVPPRWGFHPIDPQYYFTFAVMLFVGLVISELAARLQRQAAMAEARAQRSHALKRFALELVGARSAEAIAQALVAAAQEASGQPAWLCPAPDGRLPDVADAPVAAAANWLAVQAAWQRRQETGAGTTIQPQCGVRCIPLVAGDLVMGVLGLPLDARADSAHAEELQLLSALANQAAVALERALFDERTARAAWRVETERLRNTLLAGLSHDFRTPLTTIIGTVGTLLDQADAITPSERRPLLLSVLAQAERMNTLSANLLQLTRLQEGAVPLQGEWCPVDELVAEALIGCGDGADRITVEHAAEAMLWCDPTLLGQALQNLLLNALRHGGAPIRLQVLQTADAAEIVVHDSGPGLPAGIVDHGPARFQSRGGAGGTGLGLALCAAIVQLHGGRLRLANEGGARCAIELPQPVPLEPQA